jgi:DNA-binding response OmpR family regulator
VNTLIREFVVEALREAGYQVIHATTGEEALAWCKREFADVLVTDIGSPERSMAGRSPNIVASMIPTLP